MMSPTEKSPNSSSPVAEEGSEAHQETEQMERLDDQSVKTSSTPEGLSNGDVEKFDGKIVYNPDGSAYIIEDGDLSDEESLPIPRLEGSIVVKPGEEKSNDDAIPQIANAFYISKSTAYYNALYGQAYVKLLQEKNLPETPVVHSYRVFTPRDRNNDDRVPEIKHSPLTELSTVPVKPILMCFVCKLSFGCAQTFGSHCIEAHNVQLNSEEKSILESKNSSAIIQVVGKEKEPLVSFLEPVMSKESAQKPPISPGAINDLISAAAAATSLPKVPTIPPLAPINTTAAMAGELNHRRSPLSASSPPAVPTTPSSSEARKSPSESVRSSAAASPSSHANSPSPMQMLQSSSYPQMPTNANMLQGTTIGACPDHVGGRPTGVDCSKCDLILNQSRMSGMGWNVSRNSCKTLKCPKCNWHYKYQETLEIHMKEKHPENETTCIYCITGQQHPRLARGETYTCGYKPYRCEVCNYSTTTKGNLSIHMQSDKHLNNMQDLQNGTISAPTTSASTSETSTKIPSSPIIPPAPRNSTSMPSSSPLPSPSKQKPNWRCDVCNYETSVARNLRIHMTSEKHTHNMMSMQQQQNVKGLQHFLPSGFPSLPPLAGGMDPKALLGGLGGLLGLPPPTSSTSEQAVMADLAYNQAVLAQIMSGGQFPGGVPPLIPPQPTSSSASSTPDIASIFAAAAAAAASANNEDMNAEPPPEQVDINPTTLLSCCVCKDFGCDVLDELSQHLAVDRSRSRENEVSIVIGGNYLCQLCNYKTNLKANFQLHCKTDKHLQRLSHVNHIKDGGPSNEWKLRFLSNMNPVEIRCNACDFMTNSPHKMQVHFTNQQHQVSSLLFSHLKKCEREKSSSDRLSYNCTLCQFSAPGKHLLMTHVRSIKHLQMEQMHQLKKRAEGNLAQTEIGDIFQVVVEFKEEEENNVKEARHQQIEEEISESKEISTSPLPNIACPLCQEHFKNQDLMEAHAMDIHSVNAEGLQRLQSLINGSHWLNKTGIKSPQSEASMSDGNNKEQDKKEQDSESSSDISERNKSDLTSPSNRKDSSFNYSMEKYMDPNRPFKCEVCKESFTQKNILLVHYNSVSHLHRLKKSMQEQQSNKEGEANGGGSNAKDDIEKQQQQDLKTPTKGSALEALLGNIRGERKDDDEVKPFKCNICKVAYSQGSTLDIHIRSVLHQTKASKLQELILTGQIDLSKPLIEQPDPQSLQDQHKKMINDMLSPKSMNSTGSTISQSSPNVRSSSPNRSSSPQSSPLANLQVLMGNKTSSPTDASSGEESSSVMNNLAKTFPFLPNLANLSPPENRSEDNKGEGDMPSPVLKNLLQTYGLDFMKQFSELKRQGDESKKFEDRNNDKESNNGRSTPISDSHSRPSSRPNSSQPSSNLAEVQEALQKAMIQAQLQQMNPMLMQMSQLQGLNPLVAMNLHPPLIPPALLKTGGGNADFASALGGQPPPLGMMDPKFLALMAANRNSGNNETSSDFKPNTPGSTLFPPMGLDPKLGMQKPVEPKPQFSANPSPDPKALLMQQQPVPPVDQGKRARTRITDEQLKILRSNFDINNSPTEEMLNMMAGQTGLPLKVIKHWFRNTLFKERQKNKDSPYNFSNPPSTKLNLEEYEKTGEPKVTPLKPEDQAEYVQESEKIKKEVESTLLKSEPVKIESPEATNSNKRRLSSDDASNASNKVPKLNDSSSENNSLTLSRLLSSQFSHLPHPNNFLPNFPAIPPAAPLPPTSTQLPDYLNSLASRITGGASGGGRDPSPRPQSPQHVSGGKRANRTRFTDYQIKVLQEFFENNAYPKDDDLEYLSKLLGLSPRVIVVWFQNARQKARKIYENQPPSDASSSNSGNAAAGSTEEENGRFTRTPGCNYQCKKCLLVFQRYYELIRHQKQHCYKEEDAKRSAQAQKAAAQAAAQFGGGNHPPPLMPNSEDSNSSIGNDHNITSPVINLPNTPDDKIISEIEKRRELAEMSKEAVNRMFNNANQFLNYPPTSPFGLLQQQALQQQNNHSLKDDSDGIDSGSEGSSPSSKPKFSEDGEGDDDAQRDKRLRTSILPEQLDFLCQKFQQESNPSRKMLEQIASEVGLRKRVVQVWFQNSRARERKGLSIKRNSDDEQERPELPESPFAVSDQLASLMPNSTSAFNLQNSMRKYYEDTMKRFMNDINESSAKSQQASANSLNNDSALDLTSNCDESSDHLEDYDTNKSMDTESINGGNSNKRFRTQMSGVQVKMMKAIFEVYKTPTMTECSSLGQDIGLQKRVVQVWFQNARAKEKRAKLQLQQATGQEPDGPPLPEACQVCGFKYSHKYAVQDHIFTRSHLDNLRAAIEAGRYDPESPGYNMAQTAAVIQASGQRNPSTDSASGNQSLQMLQMSTTAQVNNRELLDSMSPHQNPRMLMQV